MKTILKIAALLILISFTLESQTMKVLSKAGIAKGRIVYFETFENLPDMKERGMVLSSAAFRLNNITTGMLVQKRDSLEIDSSANSIRIYFLSDALKEQQDCKFILAINDTMFISTDTTFASGLPSLRIDVKPSFDDSEPQKLDVEWEYKSSNGILLSAKGYFSTRPDSSVLNSVQWHAGIQYILAVISGFKYIGIKGQVGGEHPQNFSQTNAVGSVSLSTIIPGTDRLARFFSGDRKNSSIGLIIQPAVDFVVNTTVKDSSYLRGALHGNWRIPIMDGQYMSWYGVVYLQDKFRPRSFIEMTYTQSLSPSLDVFVKWINGQLPPLFQREVDFRIGLSWKK